MISCLKLLITVVQKGSAKTIVQATRNAGAEGGTIFLGKGTGIYDKRFFGIPVTQDKEIILTLFPRKIEEALLAEVGKEGRLNETGRGIAMVIELSAVAGIPHFCQLDPQQRAEMKTDNEFALIVTVVDKGNAESVVEASKKAGAQGGTIINGRGTGIHEKETLFSIPIEPEKDVVLTLIDREKSEDVLQAIRRATELDIPGKGIAFVLPVDRTSGIKRLNKADTPRSLD